MRIKEILYMLLLSLIVFNVSCASLIKGEKGNSGGSVFVLKLQKAPDDPLPVDMKCTLFSTDGQYSKTLTPQDDTGEYGGFITLKFEGVIDELDYSLEIDPGAGGEKYLIFEDVPYGLLEEW